MISSDTGGIAKSHAFFWLFIITLLLMAWEFPTAFTALMEDIYQSHDGRWTVFSRGILNKNGRIGIGTTCVWHIERTEDTLYMIITIQHSRSRHWS